MNPSSLRNIILLAAFLAMFPCRGVSAQADTPPGTHPDRQSVVFDRRESVLERLKAFKGAKTREAVAGLFTWTDPAFIQEPSIILSDGVARAGITLRVAHRKESLPKFSVTGGHCISAEMIDNGVWKLQILPNRGAFATSVTVLTPQTMTEYPLTVAPPLNLIDPRTAEIVEIEYALTANELAMEANRAERRR